MPQFYAGEIRKANVSVQVQPAGHTCRLEVFLGPNDATKVATGVGPFINSGSVQEVAVPVVMPATGGVYHVYIDVYIEGEYIAGYVATEDVVVGASIVLSILPSSLVRDWEARVYDFVAAKWLSSSRRSISQLSGSFGIIGSAVLLEVTQYQYYVDYGWGPSSKNINLLPDTPISGSYQYSGDARTLDGITMYAGEQIPSSQITGTLTKIEQLVNWAGDTETWYTFLIDWADGGIGKYYIGQSVRGQASTAVSGLIQGQKYSAHLFVRENIGGTVAPAGSVAWCFFYDQVRAPSPYPPEYFNFTGSLKWWASYPTASEEVYISGTAPVFAVIIIASPNYGTKPPDIKYQWRFNGPFFGMIDVPYERPLAYMMFAHPDINMVFDPNTWELDNWKMVAVASTED